MSIRTSKLRRLGGRFGATVTVDPTVPVLPTELRGLNISGQEFGGTQYAGPSPQALTWLAGTGANHVRIPYRMERLTPTLNGVFDQTPLAAQYKGLLDGLVNKALSLGLSVALDPHSYMRFTVGAAIDDQNLTGGTEYLIGQGTGPAAGLTNSNYAAHMAAVANRWGKLDPRVVLELGNEPHDMLSTELYATMQAGATAMRATGWTGKLLVPGNQWNTGGWGANGLYGADNRAKMAAFVDPNFAVMCHHYDDAGGPGQSDSVDPNQFAVLQAFTADMRSIGKKAVLNEYGSGKGSLVLATLAAVMREIKGNPDVYVGFAPWRAAHYQSGDYLNEMPAELIGQWDHPGPYTEQANFAVVKPYFSGSNFAAVFKAPPVVSLSGTTLTANTDGAYVGLPVPIVTARQWLNAADAVVGTGTTLDVSAMVGQTIRRAVTAGGVIGISAGVLIPAASLATLDATNKRSTVAISNANRTAALANSPNDNPGVAWPIARATVGKNAGKFFFEVVSTTANGSMEFGLVPTSYDLTVNSTVQLGDIPGGIALRGEGSVIASATFAGDVFTSATNIPAGAVIAIAVDLSINKIWFKIGGQNWNNDAAQDPSTGAGGISFTRSAGAVTPAVGPFYFSATMNFGQAAYANAVPTGFGNWL